MPSSSWERLFGRNDGKGGGQIENSFLFGPKWGDQIGGGKGNFIWEQIWEKSGNLDWYKFLA